MVRTAENRNPHLQTESGRAYTGVTMLEQRNEAAIPNQNAENQTIGEAPFRSSIIELFNPPQEEIGREIRLKMLPYWAAKHGNVPLLHQSNYHLYFETRQVDAALRNLKAAREANLPPEALTKFEEAYISAFTPIAEKMDAMNIHIQSGLNAFREQQLANTPQLIESEVRLSKFNRVLDAVSADMKAAWQKHWPSNIQKESPKRESKVDSKSIIDAFNNVSQLFKELLASNQRRVAMLVFSLVLFPLIVSLAPLQDRADASSIDTVSVNGRDYIVASRDEETGLPDSYYRHGTTIADIQAGQQEIEAAVEKTISSNPERGLEGNPEPIILRYQYYYTQEALDEVNGNKEELFRKISTFVRDMNIRYQNSADEVPNPQGGMVSLSNVFIQQAGDPQLLPVPYTEPGTSLEFLDDMDYGALSTLPLQNAHRTIVVSSSGIDISATFQRPDLDGDHSGSLEVLEQTSDPTTAAHESTHEEGNVHRHEDPYGLTSSSHGFLMAAGIKTIERGGNSELVSSSPANRQNNLLTGDPTGVDDAYGAATAAATLPYTEQYVDLQPLDEIEEITYEGISGESIPAGILKIHGTTRRSGIVDLRVSFDDGQTWEDHSYGINGNEFFIELDYDGTSPITYSFDGGPFRPQPNSEPDDEYKTFLPNVVSSSAAGN